MTVLAWLVIIGLYVVTKVRGYWSDTGQSVDKHLSDFRRMHEQGKLEDGEFRTIKRVLTRRGGMLPEGSEPLDDAGGR